MHKKKTAWDDVLPSSYSWLKQVKIFKKDTVDTTAHHLVPVKVDADNKEKFSILGLDSALAEKVAETAQKIGWKPGAGVATYLVDDKRFVLLEVPSVKTRNVQLSREMGINAAKYLVGRDVSEVSICHDDTYKALDIFEGLVNGMYDCHFFTKEGKKTEDLSKYPGKVSIYGYDYSEEELTHYVAITKASLFTRQLQDAPPNYLNSIRFAEIAEELAEVKGLKCSVTGREGLKKMGMGSFLSVAAGTPIDPKLIVIEIEGKDPSKTVALVGKGLTFDAGGISLKPSAGMGEMKYDMSGGGAVLGTALYLSHVKPAVNTVCVIGAVENMPGVSATRPGDIIQAMNGKTIEVLNTDAEGRLVLVDCLHYAITEYKPNLVIDIATLTGAVLHGLGSAGSAMMTNDKGTTDYLLNVSDKVGEPYWEMPMWPELEAEVKSKVADYKNIASANVKAGTIMAGTFLKQFVGDTNWAHLDIAGTGWSCSTTGFCKNGGAAFGLKLMSEVCASFEA